MCRGAGPWQGLLLDVMTIIEGVGGITQMTRSPRRQAQLAMFVWSVTDPADLLEIYSLRIVF